MNDLISLILYFFHINKPHIIGLYNYLYNYNNPIRPYVLNNYKCIFWFDYKKIIYQDYE